jgi:hypothetical protein
MNNPQPEQESTALMAVSVIASIIQNNLENPPLSLATRDRAVKIESANQHGRTLKTIKPAQKSSGKPVKKLSFHDREDIAQEILATLAEHGLMPQGKRSRVAMLRAETKHGDQFFTGGGHCLAWLNKSVKINDKITTVWQELFRRCRFTLRMQHKIENSGKVYLETLVPDTIAAISTERHYRQESHKATKQIHVSADGKKSVTWQMIRTTTPRRKALAQDARLMKRAIFHAFKADTSRQKKSKFAKAHSFLKASIATVQENGHGLNTMTRKARCDKKLAFKQYILIGLAELPAFELEKSMKQLANMFAAK